MLSVEVVLFKPLSQIGSEPLSQIASQGSTRQAHESCWQQCYRGDISYGALSLLSHGSDGAAEVTCPRCDVDVESCWQWH
jgi:hypothetical protein